MKYYYPEHLTGYERIKTESKRSWGEIHGDPDGFEQFSSRGFLERILPRLQFSDSIPKVLEYGCGTGPGACFLAERGFEVEAIDLIPTAIELAKQIACERGLDIRYWVLTCLGIVDTPRSSIFCRYRRCVYESSRNFTSEKAV